MEVFFDARACLGEWFDVCQYGTIYDGQFMHAAPGRRILSCKNSHLKIFGYSDADLVGRLIDKAI